MTRFVAYDLEESELKYHLETMKKNATYLSVATFDELQLAINKHIETDTTMELSLVNNCLCSCVCSPDMQARSFKGIGFSFTAAVEII